MTHPTNTLDAGALGEEAQAKADRDWWQEFADQIGWRLIGWTGRHYATFQMPGGKSVQLDADVLCAILGSRLSALPAPATGGEVVAWLFYGSDGMIETRDFALSKAERDSFVAQFPDCVEVQLYALPPSAPDPDALDDGRVAGLEEAAEIVDGFGAPYTAHTTQSAVVFRTNCDKIAAAIRARIAEIKEGKP